MIIRTDHRPLTFITAGSESNRKLARWWSIVNEFDYELEYVKGKSNQVADALSRMTTGVIEFANETLEVSMPLVHSVHTRDCQFCDDEYDSCDKCGKQMCLVCQLGSPSHLPFLYCRECVEHLDSDDPTMNLPLLKLLMGDGKEFVLPEVGYEKFE